MSTQELQSRIAAERQRLTTEEERERQLTADRAGPLEAGNDAEVDRIETAMSESRTLQLRLIERIQILEQRLGAEHQAERERELDAVLAKAEQARALGEKIIRGDYIKQARALAATLAKLDALDAFIHAQRDFLSRHGREIAVADSNAFRSILPRRYTETVRKRVGLNEPLHPYYRRARAPRNVTNGLNPEVPVDDLPGVTTPVYVEVDVVEDRHESATWATPLYEVCTIPPVDVQEQPLWSAEKKSTEQRIEDRKRILAELGLDETDAKRGGVASKVLSALGLST